MNKLFSDAGLRNLTIKEVVAGLPVGCTIFGNSAALIAGKRDDLIADKKLQVSIFRDAQVGDELDDMLDDLGFVENYTGKASTVFPNTTCTQFEKNGIKFVVYDEQDGATFQEFEKEWRAQSYTDVGLAAIYRSDTTGKLCITTSGHLTPDMIVDKIQKKQFSIIKDEKIKTDSTKRFIAALKDAGFMEVPRQTYNKEIDVVSDKPKINANPIPPPMPSVAGVDTKKQAYVDTPKQVSWNEHKKQVEIEQPKQQVSWVVQPASPMGFSTGFTIKRVVPKLSFGQMTKQDAIKAAYRIAGHQISSAVKKMIINLMRNQGKDNATVETIADMLNTEYGEAIVSTLIGMSLTYAPSNVSENIHVQNIAKEFRVNGMATAGNALVEDVVDALLPVIYNTLSTLPQIEALQQPAETKNNEKELAENEAEMELQKSAVETKHMTA